MSILRFILFLTFTAVTSGTGAASLSGRVVTVDDAPVADVEVRLLNSFHSDVTDSSGRFQIKKVPAGRYDVVFRHIGFRTRILSSVRLTDAGTVELGTVHLEFGIFDTEDVIVTATRTEHQTHDLAQSVGVVTANRILERSAKTSAEALREEPAVFVQKTNHGGGSAIIRGMSSSQILLLIDGVRLNNSTYRLGNHQYLTTVDFGMLDQIEVMRGPGSVQYGSDALGGTINLKTFTPELAEGRPFFHFSTFGRYANADGERLIRPQFSYHHSHMALSAGFTLKYFQDLRRGTNSHYKRLERSPTPVQSPSGFSARDFDLKLRYRLSDAGQLTGAYQRSDQDYVPRYDKYENDGYHRWLYEPQERDLWYLTYRHSNPFVFMNSMRLTLSYQNQLEGRIIQKRPEAVTTHERDEVRTLGLSAQFDAVLPGQLITYGFDYYSDRVKSRRNLEEPLSGSISSDPRGRYPDGAEYDQLGVFLQDEIWLSERLMLTPGLRYSLHEAGFALPADTLSGPLSETVNLDFTSLTGSAGIVYRLTDELNVSLLYSQGFRAPNLSDLSKLGESKSSVYEIPNPELKPEQAQNFETGIRLRNSRGEASISVYYSRLHDLLASADDLFQGKDFIDINGQLFRVKSKQNIGQGYITGFEHTFRYRTSNDLLLHGHATYTYGQNTTAAEPIGGIPPFFGLLGIRYKHNRFDFDAYMRFALRQDRLSADDLDDLRIPDGGTPGWYTLNLRVFFPVTHQFRLHAGIENLLDLNYREHGSGINAPGRNLILSFEYRR